MTTLPTGLSFPLGCQITVRSELKLDTTERAQATVRLGGLVCRRSFASLVVVLLLVTRHATGRLRVCLWE
jgi:hypothetical protein